MFAFEIEADTEAPVPVGATEAVINCRFRHSDLSAIRLAPGAEGELNIGFRVYSNAHAQLFEHRMVPETLSVEPGVWINCTMNIPRRIVDFEHPFSIVVDMVKEQEYWFSTTGSATFTFKVTFFDVLAPVHTPTIAVARSPAEPAGRASYGELDEAFDALSIPEDAAAASRAPAPAPANVVAAFARPGADDFAPSTAREAMVASAPVSQIVFDVSDLIQYYLGARLPTGIQRVQIEIISSVIAARPDGLNVMIVCFTKERDYWVEIQKPFFSALCRLSLIDGDPAALDWLRAIERLRQNIFSAPDAAFERGAYLLNLGTSWWLRNYFLNVRLAKEKYQIKYVQFIHDCIPIITPEHCTADLTRDYISWIVGAFDHCDRLFANSGCTARDVMLVARHLGHEIAPPTIVRLDADYRRGLGSMTEPTTAPRPADVLSRHDLKPGEYVLFVSTIESRKNHLLAFSVWLKLLKRHGTQKVPKLVCVGNRGWLNDAIYARLAASELLQQHVVMLSRVPDADLAPLYGDCLFTLYPSSYEGWGLPVTESLCYGKVPLLSESSSLPESGGKFAEFFNLDSEVELTQKLERLIFDEPYRRGREAAIAAEFRPRSWGEIAAEVIETMCGWAQAENERGRLALRQEARAPGAFPAEFGRYNGFVENEETQVWRGMGSGEHFRHGRNWWWCEPWGCWTKAGPAQIVFAMAPPKCGSVVLYLGIRGVQATASNATVGVDGLASRKVKLGASEDRWLAFRLDRAMLERLSLVEGRLIVRLTVSADQKRNFRSSAEDVDFRIASVGVRGFMVCEEADTVSRLNFLDCVALGDIAGLLGRPSNADVFLPLEVAALPPSETTNATNAPQLQFEATAGAARRY